MEPPESDSNPTLVFPQLPSDRPLHLVVYGDTRFADPSVTVGTNPRIRHWLADQIGLQHPQAILITGDTPFHGGLPEDWLAFQQETASWREAGALQLPTIGNHEVYGGPKLGIANYLQNFPDIAQHRYYSALLGCVEVLSLDSTQPTGVSSPQGRWFVAQLDHVPPQVEFLIILHHLPWMVDRQSQIFAGLPTKDCLALRDLLEARIARIHAKVLVINGHVHNYERFERLGVEYVITGGGGAKPYPVLYRGDGDLYKDMGFPVYHYLVIDVADHKLHAVMWKVKDPEAANLEVEAKDDFSIEASASPLARPSLKHRRRHISPD